MASGTSVAQTPIRRAAAAAGISRLMVSPLLHKKRSQNKGNNKDQMTYIKYKTTLCRHWEDYGTCSLADACSFAHGDTEKRGINDVSFRFLI